MAPPFLWFLAGAVLLFRASGQAEAEAMRLAGQIAANAPLAVRASRQVVLAAQHADDETLKAMSSRLMAEVFVAEDTTEGLTAFIEKRAPQWKGR